MSDELKPCPFCCGTLGGNNASGHADDCYIVMLLRKQGEPSEFNAAWNRRAPCACQIESKRVDGMIERGFGE